LSGDQAHPDKQNWNPSCEIQVQELKPKMKSGRRSTTGVEKRILSRKTNGTK
jgi:hypothetical protein